MNSFEISRYVRECAELERAVGMTVTERTIAESIVNALPYGRRYPREVNASRKES